MQTYHFIRSIVESINFQFFLFVYNQVQEMHLARL